MTELVVIRVVRPYATESEFLQSEDWTIKRNSVFLVGASEHAEGTIVRCELALSGGTQLLVAEGVVAKHVAHTAERPEGLVVRFRRMTPASTQFINRILSNRDAVEGSSPSSAAHPTPGPSAKFEETQVHQQRQHVAPPKAAAVLAAGENGTLSVLRRLSGRNSAPIAVPLDRASILQRLRQRSSAPSHH